MKKQILLVAAAAFILASCGSNEKKQEGPTQAQIDSAVNAKMAQHDAENAAKNDSTLKAIEAEKAAAMAKEQELKQQQHSGGAKKHSGSGKKEAAAPPPPPPPAPAKSAQDSKFENRQGNQPAQKTAEEQKAQDDKFNRRGK